MKNKFDLSKEEKQEMANTIKQYFLEERNEEIGDLAAILFLDFFTDQLAPAFYNLGVEDAHAFMNDKIEDLFALQKK